MLVPWEGASTNHIARAIAIDLMVTLQRLQQFAAATTP